MFYQGKGYIVARMSNDKLMGEVPRVMKKPITIGKLVVTILVLLILAPTAHASVTVNPKVLFLDGIHKSVSLTVSNTAEEDAEVWIDVRYGYETTDDSGRIIIHFDSLALNEPSAAMWIRCYPRRFALGAGENQTVRIAVFPPAGIADGEYWARILVTSKPRNVSRTPISGATTSAKPGLNILTQLSLPFHYRVGKLTTGLEVTTQGTALNDTAIILPMQLTRTGNASYWGTRTIKLSNQSGKVVSTVTKNIAVYKTTTVLEKISRAGLPAGAYDIDVEFNTGKRMDIRSSSLVQSTPVHVSASVVIP